MLRVVTRIDSLPSESTFSRAFWEFAENGLGDKVQSEMVKEYVGDQINGHISRDATAINGHEKAAKKRGVKEEEKAKMKEKVKQRGRPKNGAIREDGVEKKDEERRMVRQVNQTVADALLELPTVCDVGCKKNAKGYKESWIGYKLHAVGSGSSCGHE